MTFLYASSTRFSSRASAQLRRNLPISLHSLQTILQKPPSALFLANQNGASIKMCKLLNFTETKVVEMSNEPYIHRTIPLHKQEMP
jgi:hypothetical protein